MPDPSRTELRRRRRSRIVAFVLISALFGLALLAWYGLRENESPDFNTQPEIPDPVDVVSVGRVRVNPEDNAFELYRQASRFILPLSPAATQKYSDAAPEAGWEAVGPELRDWLEQNRPALNMFREGSKRIDAIYWQPADLTLTSNMDVLQQMRQMFRLVQLEALRMSDAGDYDAEWAWYRTLLRASRHAGMHGAVMERLFGNAFHAFALKQIVRWAANPAVNSEMLRSALDETRSIYKQTVPVSVTLKIEYLMTVNSMRDRSIAGRLAEEELIHPRGDGESLLRRSNEPAISIRVTKLAFANWLSRCDLPRSLRGRTDSGELGLFHPDPDAPSHPREFAPDEIERLLAQTVLAKSMLPTLKLYIVSDDRERAKQGLLEIALALQCHYREYGAFPDTIQPVAEMYFSQLPVDPFGNGEPLHFRLEPDHAEGVTLWSIGPDATDDDGKIDILTNGGHTGDLVVRVRPPRPAD